MNDKYLTKSDSQDAFSGKTKNKSGKYHPLKRVSHIEASNPSISSSESLTPKK